MSADLYSVGTDVFVSVFEFVVCAEGVELFEVLVEDVELLEMPAEDVELFEVLVEDVELLEMPAEDVEPNKAFTADVLSADELSFGLNSGSVTMIWS